MKGNCKFRDELGHCKIGVADEDEVCDIVTAEPYCADYEEIATPSNS
jgi:hypothetical protein